MARAECKSPMALQIVKNIMTMEAICSAFKNADTIKELNFDPQPYGFRKGASYVKNENAPLHKDLKLFDQIKKMSLNLMASRPICNWIQKDAY